MLLKFPQQKTKNFPQQVLEFRIGSQKLGFEITRILEVTIPKQITRVPECTPFFQGMTNIRGHVLPLIDIREKLGQPPMMIEKPAHAIIFEIPGLHVGVVADAVVHALRQTAAGKVTMELDLPFRDLIFFLLEVDGENLPVLKTDNLINEQEAAILEKIAKTF